ncbi:helix-turn-helix domain-containing protein [Lysinibacillus xylanilyticus]|uniref:helix-turn-helix domain-containing protein n=1 Tax=Lysinibacillus xylanilyticus TaxID=582475 RepID=UPI003809D6F1
MSNAKNSRYRVISNANDFMSQVYKSEKELRAINGQKYTLNDFCEEVAEYCGISPSTVSQIRIRNLQPSFIVSIKLAEFLEVDVSELFEIVEVDGYKNNREKCIIDGCERIATTKGYCMKHLHKGYAE